MSGGWDIIGPILRDHRKVAGAWGRPYADAMAKSRCSHGKPLTEHCNECQLEGYCACPSCEAEA